MGVYKRRVYMVGHNPFHGGTMLDDITSTWSMCTTCMETPWSGGEHTGRPLADRDGIVRCHVVEVCPSTSEYASVAAFIGGVLSVHRVQHFGLYEKYQRKYMEDIMYNRDAVEPVRLWHGSSSLETDPICAQGLDQRLGTRGNFGRGIYFSDSFHKAHQYTNRDDDIRTMFLCRVNLGTPKEYPPGVNDTSLLREPDGYTSVTGRMLNHNEMVVYENDRVYIEYIIYYMTL